MREQTSCWLYRAANYASLKQVGVLYNRGAQDAHGRGERRLQSYRNVRAKHMHPRSPLESKQNICGASQEEGSPAAQTGGTNLRLFSHTAGEDRKPAMIVHDATTSARAHTASPARSYGGEAAGELFRRHRHHARWRMHDAPGCTRPRRGSAHGRPWDFYCLPTNQDAGTDVTPEYPSVRGSSHSVIQRPGLVSPLSRRSAAFFKHQACAENERALSFQTGSSKHP